MSIIYLIVLILLFMVILTFTAILKVAFTLDTERENIQLTLLWLYPFMKVTAESNDDAPLLSVYLFNKRVYGRKISLKKTGTRNADFVKSVSPSDVHFDISYGFRDPFITGITCGAIHAASEYMSFVSIKQSPDFVANNDYVYMDATAKVNIGNTFIHFLKSKTQTK